jgi:hypothetical protein
MSTSRPAARLEPLAGDRYLLRVTISAETYARLRRAQDLLAHTVPNGDTAAVLDRALILLVGQLERTKFAAVRHPRRPAPSSEPQAPSTASGAPSRHVPAAVKRAVWRHQFTGTRRFSSSNQFITTTISSRDVSTSIGLIMRKRSPPHVVTRVRVWT